MHIFQGTDREVAPIIQDEVSGSQKVTRVLLKLEGDFDMIADKVQAYINAFRSQLAAVSTVSVDRIQNLQLRQGNIYFFTNITLYYMKYGSALFCLLIHIYFFSFLPPHLNCTFIPCYCRFYHC